MADFLVQKDRLFAELTLDEHEFKLYEQVYSHLTLDAPVPDLVIYLQAPVDTLVSRIQRRGRAFEQRVDAGYLRRLSDAYAGFFHQITTNNADYCSHRHAFGFGIYRLRL